MITVMELQLIFFLSFLHGIHGQVTAPPSTAVARGEDLSLVCTSTETNPVFTWAYVTEGQSLYTGTTRATNIERYANIVLQEGTAAQTSILNINAIELEEEGAYLCSTTTATTNPPNTVVTVEVASAPKEMELINIDNFANYQATCDAIGSKPEENITWVLDGVTHTVTDGVVETDPDISADSLFDKRSVFTFPASLDNYNVTLVCQIGGHQVPGLGRNESRFVDVQSKPTTNIRVEFQSPDASLTVSCVIDDPTQPIPSIMNYYIYSNDTLILQSSMGDNDVDVSDTEFDLYTVFTCVAGNYLGNVTSQPRSYDPDRTTTPPPTTATEGTSPVVDSGTPGTGGDGANIGAIAGGVVGGIACFVIIVLAVYCCKKQEYCCFADGGLKSSGSGKKPAGSAVGSSNGSEKDKINQPVAAQRSQAPIQHTASNPGQELYALPERKQPAGGRGGDAPDRGSGPGQNEPQDIFYADLDLSSKAGHTEKHIPKNENDVVVYSSILV